MAHLAAFQAIFETESRMLPDFIIIGAMKAGTTSLQRYIASHPEIVGSTPKETDFFKTKDTFQRGTAWYRALFKGTGHYAIEASPNYTKRHLFPGVPERMHAILPKAKLIYIVRDPIERILSHYVQNVTQSNESRTISEAIKANPNNYIQTSRYYFQLDAFLSYYPDERIFIVESERLKKETWAVLQEVSAFLEVSTNFDSLIIEKRFHSSDKKKRRSSLERKLTNKTSNRYLLALIRFLSTTSRTTVEKPILSGGERERLADQLKDDVEKFRRFSGQAFSSWSL